MAEGLITISLQPSDAEVPLSARLMAVVLTQPIMFVPLVVLRFTLLKDPLRPRPWVALAGFAVASLVGNLSVYWLLSYLYAGGFPILPEWRVMAGVLPTMIPLIVVAYVVNTLRERRGELEALVAVREQLELARAEASRAVQQRNDELVGRVRAVLGAEIASLASSQPADAVALLQHTATDVVRPLSHELATSFADQEERPASEPSSRVGWRDVVGAADVDGPLLPGGTVLLLSGIWISGAAVAPGDGGALLVSLLLIYCLLAGANVVLRVLLRRWGPMGRLLAVLLACVLVGVINDVALRRWSGDAPVDAALAAAATFFVILVSAGMAVVKGVFAARSAIASQLAVSNEELRLQVLRTQQLLWFHQRALARALHGPVQSAVVAAALRLADAAPAGGPSPDLIEGVRTDLMRVLDVLNSPEDGVLPLDACMARLVGTWQGVCDIVVDVDPDAATVISDDVVIRALVVDIVTEAVANAVRHGHAREVSVRMRAGDDTLTLTVGDDGHATSASGLQGLGTQLLNDCARMWSLSDTGSGRETMVALPVPPRGIPSRP